MRQWLAGVALLILAGCAGQDAAPPAGKVIAVRMVTDETGNRFEPALVRARRGDVVRFVLASGVHGVSFPTAPAALPRRTELLHELGATQEVRVTLPPGDYTFQCDPHVALGMTGTLRVE